MMQKVSQTVAQLVNGLVPIKLSLQVLGEQPLEVPVLQCSVSARCSAGESFGIGSACSAEAEVTLDKPAGLGLQSKWLQLRWQVKNSFYPLFTGWCEREWIEGSTLQLQLKDAIYINGGAEYRRETVSNAKEALISVLNQMGHVALEEQTAADAVGVPLRTEHFPEHASCADMLGWIAAAMGGNAWIDRAGSLIVRGHTKAQFQSQCYDSGLSRDVKPFQPSGLCFVREIADGSKTRFSAGDGSIEIDMPFADQQMVNRVWGQVKDLRCYAGRYTIPGGLLLEPGDLIQICTGSECYPVLCSDLAMQIDGGVKTTIACSGAGSEGGASGSINHRLEQAEDGLSHVEQMVQEESTAREKAVEALNKILADSTGIYSTEEVLPDGSKIIYTHDKPSLAQSKVVAKITADAIAWSTNGGKTYDYGFSVDGTALLEKIYAVGINADHISAGTLSGVKIICEEGSVGGLTMSSHALSAEYRHDYPKFTQADVERAQQGILGVVNLSEEEKRKYDVNMDGRLTAVDLLAMQKMISGMEPPYSVYRLTIDPTRPNACVQIEVVEGYHTGWGAEMGMGMAKMRSLSVTGQMTIQNEPLADFVMENGFNRYWNWRKWNSGLAECWCTHTFPPVRLETWGSMYSSVEQGIQPLRYPLSFVEKPVCTMSLEDADYDCVLYVAAGESYDRTLYTPMFQLMRPTVTTNGMVQPTVSFHAVGRWK